VLDHLITARDEGLINDELMSAGRAKADRVLQVINGYIGYLSRSARSPARMNHGSRVTGTMLKMGDYYRRMRAKLGAAEGLVATAHKIARILYAVMTTHRPYDPSLHEHALAETRRRRITRLHSVAKNLGFQLIPNQQTVLKFLEQQETERTEDARESRE
jgi:hypothetical protein